MTGVPPGETQDAMTLCVLLWAAPGEEEGLVAYEDTVLRLVPRHGGRVISRVRRKAEPAGDTTGAEQPYEVQLIEMPDDGALAAYMADPERTALGQVHRRVVARTDVIRVSPV